MTIGAHTISPKQGSARTKKRLGRGNASQKGTYSGRGMKGQKARSGGRAGQKVRGLKQAILKAPKLRGFQSMHPKAQTVTLAMIERLVDSGTVLTPKLLKQKHAIKDASLPVKIVASGELKKKVTVKYCLATKTAVNAIEQAGGTVTF
jgi:large subunit ribosomal protein L15